MPGWIRRHLTVLVISGCALGVATFYLVEHWRGRRAWERCAAELTAKGENLDWKAFIPPPVPDGQNFFKAPGMMAWFSSQAWQTNQQVRVFSLPSWVTNPPLTLDQLQRFPERIADRVDLANAELSGVSNNVIPLIQVANLSLRETTMRLAREAALQIEFEAPSLWPTNVDANVTIRVEKTTACAAIAALLRERGLMACWDAERKIARIGMLASREDLRRWFEDHQAEYALLAEACKRPKARLQDRYDDPIKVDVPNYLNTRAVSQALVTCANLNLLDAKIPEAIRDLDLMRRLAGAARENPTVVGTMTGVVIMDQYLDVVQDGMKIGMWSEVELQEIQSQISGFSFLDDLVVSLRAERAGIADLFDGSFLEVTRRTSAPWSNFKVWITAALLPRGWLQQNRATICSYFQDDVDPWDARHKRLYASQHDDRVRRMQKLDQHRTPYNFLALAVKQNLTRAFFTAAHVQTQLDQLRVVCALERHRIARGGCPERLDALVPEYLDAVPKDLFSDDPLHYRRNPDGSFTLWSVGWNEKDDGGQVALKQDGSADDAQGDWVWTTAAK